MTLCTLEAILTLFRQMLGRLVTTETNAMTHNEVNLLLIRLTLEKMAGWKVMIVLLTTKARVKARIFIMQVYCLIFS